MEEDNTIFDILKNLKQHHESRKNKKVYLLVDFLNTFIRSYCGSPAMNTNGQHIGGVTGFLYSIGNAIKMYRPDEIIIISDGEGGSLRRKKLFPAYKEQRRTKQIYNRKYDFESEIDDRELMQHQMQLLISMLRNLPVKFIVVPNIEADDVISYITTTKNENEIIYIMSSDKDFLQLINEDVFVWSPTKKKKYTTDDVIQEYMIHPNNYLLYRMMTGDSSDNIPGINGVGVKKIHKYFPFLIEPHKYTIDEFIEKCNELNLAKKSKTKIYTDIINSKEQLELNYKLMQLDSVNISLHSKTKIREAMGQDNFTFNRSLVIEQYIKYGLSQAMPNITGWLRETFLFG